MEVHLLREGEHEIVFPEGGAKRQPSCLLEPADVQEFHEQHGRRGLGLTQEGLTQSVRSSSEASPSAHPTPDNQAATLLGWERGCLRSFMSQGHGREQG